MQLQAHGSVRPAHPHMKSSSSIRSSAPGRRSATCLRKRRADRLSTDVRRSWLRHLANVLHFLCVLAQRYRHTAYRGKVSPPGCLRSCRETGERVTDMNWTHIDVKTCTFESEALVRYEANGT